MVTKKRKKSNINWKSCPVCGGNWKRIAGFLVCSKCQHVNHGSASIADNYEAGRIDKKPGSDEQTNAPKMIRRGRLSYKKEIE
jgi:hypothetical protein